MENSTIKNTFGSDYWNRFYQTMKMGIESVPSQFAAFSMSEFADIKAVIEFGCGSGRDSFFFSSLGKTVLAFDQSSNVIEACKQKAKKLSANVQFEMLEISLWDSTTLELVAKKYPNVKKLIYARFFLHAINETAESRFFQLCHQICNKDDVIALEFRTLNDSGRGKVTSDHYRRYINAAALIMKLYSMGFNIEYFVEGFGMAKFKDDDAHVARIVLSLNQPLSPVI